MPSMIPDIHAAIVCDDIRQERNGKFILIGLFDRMVLPRFPIRYPRFCILTRWGSGEGNFVQSTRLLDPDENVVASGKNIPVRLADINQSASNVEIFMNVPLKTPGTYSVEIRLDDDLKLRFPLVVQQQQVPPGMPENLPPPPFPE